MFSKRNNWQWQADGKAFTLFALYLSVDFELTQVSYTPSVWSERYPDSALDEPLLLKASEVYINLMRDIEMTLTAIK